MESMNAVRIHTYGGPDVVTFEDVPVPEPGTGELLVRVQAAGVNPVDWKVRDGMMKSQGVHHLPLTLGWDFSGTVDGMGPNVTGFRIGDEVFGRPDLSRDGAYAEFIVVRANEVALKPRTIDHIHAAAVPLCGLTAWQALFDVAKLEHNQTILIHGAAGGVGIYAVQLAKWKGAMVCGTASTRNQDFLSELGVDLPIDYSKTRFEDVVRGVDVVLDTIGGDTQDRSWQVIHRGGILISLVARPSEREAEVHGVRHASFLVQPNQSWLQQIADLIDAGKIKVIVDTVLPLSDVARAHAMSESHHVRGKIVLQVA